MPVSAEYPYASMEKDPLISMIHFLVKREEERAQENQELKDMVRELRETRDSLMKSAHPICERWPVQYRPLGFAAWLVQELTCRTHLLRPMTVERKRSISDCLLPKGRKNSLTFGSHDGAEVSVNYHTFIETCKMCGVSTLEYFKEFFKAAIKREQFRMYSRNVERELAQVNLKAIMLGRTDYERSAMPLCLQRICYL